MKTILFLAFLLTSDYEYQLDALTNSCNLLYGHNWQICKILTLPYDITDSLNLPNIFSGRIIDPGYVWENTTRDSCYLVVKYWRYGIIKYKTFWFIK